MNRSADALDRHGLVRTSGPPTCPECAARLEFGSDRLGRTTQSCDCGHRAHVGVRRRPGTEPDRSAS